MIGYYWDLPSGRLEDPLRVLSFNPQTAQWQFIVNQDGVVYQKDLGKKTEALGKSMNEYDPDSSWRKAE